MPFRLIEAKIIWMMQNTLFITTSAFIAIFINRMLAKSGKHPPHAGAGVHHTTRTPMLGSIVMLHGALCIFPIDILRFC